MNCCMGPALPWIASLEILWITSETMVVQSFLVQFSVYLVPISPWYMAQVVLGMNARSAGDWIGAGGRSRRHVHWFDIGASLGYPYNARAIV